MAKKVVEVFVVRVSDYIDWIDPIWTSEKKAKERAKELANDTTTIDVGVEAFDLDTL